MTFLMSTQPRTKELIFSKQYFFKLHMIHHMAIGDNIISVEHDTHTLHVFSIDKTVSVSDSPK